MAEAAFNPAGSKLATACQDGVARIFNVQTGQLETQLPHASSIYYLEYSRDGRWIVTASADGTAQVWDTESGLPVGEPMRHDGEVKRARFSRDDRRVVTASHDGTGRVWDAKTGFPLSESLRHDLQVRNACFSPDFHGKRVATAGRDMRTRIWHLPPAPLGPVPDWVPNWVEAVIGLRINEEGRTERVPNDMRTIREIVARAPDDYYYKRAAEWFCEDPSRRTISPFSPMTRDQWVMNRIREDNLESTERALRVDPSHRSTLEKREELLPDSSHR